MSKIKTVVTCALATVSGLCFAAGITLLAYEGSAEEHGACKKTTIND